MGKNLSGRIGARYFAAALALFVVGAAWGQHAAHSRERLRMIRGNVAQDGTILDGAGFRIESVERVSEYQGVAVEIVYTVVFDHPFRTTPTAAVTNLGPLLTANPDETQATAMVDSIDSRRAIIHIGRPELPSPAAPRGFGFVVVGP